MHAKRRFLKFASYLPLVLTCIISLFPFYWLINTSLQPLETLFVWPPKMIPSLDPIRSYFNYVKTSDIVQWLLNTLYVSGVSTLVSTVAAIPAAYAISRFRFRGRALATFMVLFTQMLPPVLLVIPIFIIFSRMDLTNSLIGLILVNIAITMPIGVWFLRGFFDTLPVELEESAVIDGCGVMGVLTKVLLPLLKPGLVATATWSFIIAWDEYLYAYTLLESKQLWTASVGLASYMGQYSTPWNEIMTGAALTTLPVLIIFAFFQKHLVGGLTGGAVKG
jgi:ABC-type glycerol-3-phosphate transport system permease component